MFNKLLQILTLTVTPKIKILHKHVLFMSTALPSKKDFCILPKGNFRKTQWVKVALSVLYNSYDSLQDLQLQ